jgi:hypothetical protein
MSVQNGTYTLGPSDATLTVRTGKAGAASRAGHNLRIEVGDWSATLTIADDPAGSSLELTADSRSLRVLEGTGGIQGLTEDDKASIGKTINDEVLKGGAISFRSSHVERTAAGLRVQGELELFGGRRPAAFELAIDDGRLIGEAVISHADYGTKPYSALFGTLKVADQVRVTVDGHLAAQSR